MLKIGDFSKLSRISIRTLRHYDEIGLLKPEKVDDFTGYRYYKESQLVQAGRISVLRFMGFGLAEIQNIVVSYSDADALKVFLSVKKKEILEQQEQMQQKLLVLDNTIEWLRKDGNMMGYEVSLKTMPGRFVASVRQVIPTYAEEGILWGILMKETAPLSVQMASPSCSLAIFHDGEYKEKDVDVEVQMSVNGTYKDTQNVRFKTVPEMQIASATFKGGYQQINRVNEALAEWVNDNGYEFDGLSFNIYHVSPGETQNPDDYVTEICYPVKKK